MAEIVVWPAIIFGLLIGIYYAVMVIYRKPKHKLKHTTSIKPPSILGSLISLSITIILVILLAKILPPIMWAIVAIVLIFDIFAVWEAFSSRRKEKYAKMLKNVLDSK